MHKWNDNLWLLRPDEVNQLPDGTMLTAVDGTKRIKEEADLDTRFGYTAFGVEDPNTHPLRELFLIFGLKG